MNDPSFGLDIQTFSSAEFVGIRRHLGPFGDTISTDIAVNGSGQQGGSVGTNAPAGLFKVSRTGGKIETWYDVGSGWVMQDTIPNAFTSDVRIQVSAYTGDDGTFHAATDWVSFLGTEILPNILIRINGSDGPVSLAQGSQMDLTISMDPNQLAGFRGDWFIWVLSPFGPFWLNGSGVWFPSLTPVLGHQGPFFSLPSLTTFSTNTLPPGDYEFFIGVDPFPKGTIDDIDGFRWDVVLLTVF